jgi:hypothetical protein
VSRSLDSLVESGRLQSVNEGKVFLAVQSDEAVDDTEVARLEAEAKAMAAQVGELKKRAAELSSVVRACGAVQSTEQLVAGAAQLEGEIASLEARLAPLRNGGAVVNKPEEVDAAEKLALEVYGVWASRRKSFRELWDAVCEATDTAPKVLKVDVVRPDLSISCGRSSLSTDPFLLSPALRRGRPGSSERHEGRCGASEGCPLQGWPQVTLSA